MLFFVCFSNLFEDFDKENVSKIHNIWKDSENIFRIRKFENLFERLFDGNYENESICEAICMLTKSQMQKFVFLD